MKSGQTLVIALLVLGVAITVGLSIMSRSVTEVSVSTTADESSRALEAAEQGIEKSLGGIITGPSGSEIIASTNSRVQVSNSSVGGTNSDYVVPYKLNNGDVATVVLRGVNASGAPLTYSHNNITLCWGQAGDDSAVEVILYYLNGSDVTVSRMGIDSRSSPRASFSGSLSGGCTGYQWRRVVNLRTDLGMNPGTPLLLRVRALYNPADRPIAVMFRPSTALPVQGKDVISTGQSGAATQKLHAVQTTPDLPFMFDMALFSGGALVQ